ncbi:monocarboxylate transporter 12-B-like [Ruditapes philippinarum]|uniref:monocarboxylate transporter 12-B-like n=1 Tax=Ruditapes philippinarum TaxID=129788 RepID=UPI00295B7066|nr:monocarboxylate transporter 12-B-like [Ruditapes philippinarum]XP_060573754.1 monocarboxylate transporter 12-B-like [Ruditapes philippinarum]XP_060573755.1 monocarboxylate transporter 12-B-like [Ruditapes philippinarum]XP_060573756.1 monocarboxylate transporter 12-B-like [Ruditapes philippinarum]XP_060573757.1 monocarboxylate transporter 12-B-like [Ruditapes philippinarum]
MTRKRLKPTVQDRGYAWVIVAASFCIQFIQDGVRFSYGLFFVEFLKEFNTGKGQTAWVGSITLSAFNLQGPLSAYIVNRFGYRFSTILGSLITCVGFLLSYLAPNLYFLYFTYGVLQGIGFGMVFLSSFVATGKYFKKRRALAVGISFSGGGIGTLVFLPIARLIIDTFRWRGAMLILAGVALNGCVFGSLLRPFIGDESELEVVNETDGKPATIKENNKDVTTTVFADVSNTSDEHCQAGKKEEQTVPLVVMKPNEDNTENANRRFELPPSHHSSYVEDHDFSEEDTLAPITHETDTLEENEEHKELNPKILHGDTGEQDGFKIAFIEKFCPKGLVTNSNFIILMLSTVFIALPEFVPYSMLPDFALNVNCSSAQSAWMLSTVGLGALISQAGAGWIADMKCVHNLSLLGGCLLSIGVTTMIVAVIPMFWTLITYSALYGMLSGAMYAVQPIVILEYIDEKYMATMQGLTMWVYGISGLIGSPAAGWLFDATGSYTSSFLAAGGCFVLSGCINFLVLCTKRSRTARKLNKLKQDINEMTCNE